LHTAACLLIGLLRSAHSGPGFPGSDGAAMIGKGSGGGIQKNQQ
jgi:hypothetical protein